MPINFTPLYTITPKITKLLLQIEATKERILHLPLTTSVISSLRETARLSTTHYSTMIEGNRLNSDQVEKVLHQNEHFPGRERDEHEVKGYYAALEQVEKWAKEKTALTEPLIKQLHALVMSNGRLKVKKSPYRDGQNVIQDSQTRKIVYMPPEAKDVPDLMESFVKWINESHDVPCMIVAAIAHYQFATIHPYYDGNGRTARLLTTLILHRGGYNLKGIYSLEEYYARNLEDYYSAISVGPSHNYYMGRAEADITSWVNYFINGVMASFDKVLDQMALARKNGEEDQSELLRKLDPKQRIALELFRSHEIVTARQIGALFGFKPRTCAQLCKNWVESGFLEIVDFSNKKRSYRLAKHYESLIF
ncbi:MAG: Adenosine monophosphate-protein transferase SoFic [Chlamydiae bacterium]|nr:Adenosine monophosphate-protein transferase SoFic [Chlamydiota bacterium]